MANEPKPACECNVYASDGSGRVVAWRTYACPLHKRGGWLDCHPGDLELGERYAGERFGMPDPWVD
jgi:hypothetical protein